MPIPLFNTIIQDGLSAIPHSLTIIKALLTFGLLYLLKSYFSGASNTSERVLHGKVAIVTGGTSGIGAAVVRELASRGAQLVLLTRYPLSDPFLVDSIEDLRRETNNQLITAEQVDLADLHAIRRFATRWIDNAPPRRLDLLVLCADESTPPGAKLGKSSDGAELMWAVNYLANFHLASILSPAIRAQPPDRDVRVLVGMCASYLAGDLGQLATAQADTGMSKKGRKEAAAPQLDMSGFTLGQIYGTTKLALLTFCAAFQKHLSSHVRKDGLPANARVICVDPGWTRTPGMRRHLTRGSLWGLLVYLITYPLWWIVLKSPAQGAQSFLWAAMEGQLSALEEVKDCFLVKECKVIPIQRKEVHDEGTQKRLWEASDQTIEVLEKESALLRAREKKMAEVAEKSKKNEGSLEKMAGSRRSKRLESVKE